VASVLSRVRADFTTIHAAATNSSSVEVHVGAMIIAAFRLEKCREIGTRMPQIFCPLPHNAVPAAFVAVMLSEGRSNPVLNRNCLTCTMLLMSHTTHAAAAVKGAFGTEIWPDCSMWRTNGFPWAIAARHCG
jgi:hypothetical protein